MSKIIWDKTGERLYETGCDHGVSIRCRPGAFTTRALHGMV